MGEKWDRAKGEVKEQAGRATGDESLEEEGKRDQKDAAEDDLTKRN